MKILLITHDFPPNPGGIAVFLYNICLNLHSNVVVLASDGEGAADFDRQQPFSIHRFSVPRLARFWAIIRNALPIIRQQGVDVVFFGHFVSTRMLSGVLLKWLLGIPLVVLTHGDDLRSGVQDSGRIDRYLSLFVLRMCDLIFVNSTYTQKEVLNLGISPEKVRILHPGVDLNQFRILDVSQVQKACERLGLQDKQVLLTVSRLVKKKNHQLVLDLMPDLIRSVPDLVYLVVGTGPERQNLEAMVKQLGLDDRVRFVGHCPDESLVELYNMCGVFVMISRYFAGGNRSGQSIEGVEGFGITFVEAGACGKPVIGGNVGGVPDAVVDGETGLLVDSEDKGGARDAILKLLTEPNLAERMGRAGWKRAQEELGWPKVVARFRDCIAPLVKEGSGKVR